MRFNTEWFKKKWGSLTVSICIGVVLFLVLSHLTTIADYIGRFFMFFRPVFLGMAIAYVLNPLERLFEHRILKKLHRDKPRRLLSVLLSVLLVLFLVVLLGFVLIPQLVSSFANLAANMDNYVQSAGALSERFNAFMAEHGFDISQIIRSFQDWLSDLQEALPSSMQEILQVLRNVGSHILDGLIAIVLAIYFMSDKDRLLRGAKLTLQAIQKPATYQKTVDFLHRGHQILIRYILFDLLDGLLVALANFLFMAILGLPYAGLISFIVGITNLAPTFGPIVGGAIGALLLVLINPWYALYFLIFTVILQIIDGYILKPRLFGGALGVPGVIVLICIIIGGKMFGAWGVLLAIPVAAMLYYAIREAVHNRLSVRKTEQS